MKQEYRVTVIHEAPGSDPDRFSIQCFCEARSPLDALRIMREREPTAKIIVHHWQGEG